MQTSTTVWDGDTIIIASVTYILIVLFAVIPSIYVFWQLYKKAEKPGWGAIIPFYSSYVMGQIAQKKISTWVFVVANAVYAVTYFIKELELVAGLSGLVALIFGLYILNSFIKKYDAGLGRWILFIFLPLIGAFVVKPVNFKGSAQPPTPPLPGSGAAPQDATAVPESRPPYSPSTNQDSQVTPPPKSTDQV